MMDPAPVPVFQHELEFGPLLHMYRKRKPRSVLEIGVYHGGTLWYWLKEARRDAPVTVVAVDTFQEVDNRKLFPRWAPANVALWLVEGRSQDVVAQVGMFAPFDWVFIDADHHDAAVRADWENYRPMVVKGGLVAFHDVAETDDPTVEVLPLWQEIQAGYDTREFVVGDGRWGVGVVFI